MYFTCEYINNIKITKNTMNNNINEKPDSSS